MRNTVVALGLIVTTACGSPAAPPGDDRASIVAALYPLYEPAARIAGDAADVTNLTAPGVEPHDLELTSEQLDTIVDADSIVYLGEGFQPALEDGLERAQGRQVNVLDGLALADDKDPHVWLDPRLFSMVVTRIERALSEAVPAEAAAFRERAATYRGELDALDRELADGLRTCARRLVVTAHAAFGYLTARYGLEQQAIAGVSPEAEPDPKRMAELTDLVKERGVTTIFTETLVSPRVAETLAREAKVETAVLNPLEGLTQDEISAGASYFSVMRENLRVLREALGCS